MPVNGDEPLLRFLKVATPYIPISEMPILQEDKKDPKL